MKKYIYTLLAATVALPCVTAQELDSTPSVSDLTQITKLEEKKAQLKARNEVFKTNQAMNKAITDMLKVKKNGDAVDELVKYYLLIDTSAPANEVNWMRGTCLGRMLGIAVSLRTGSISTRLLPCSITWKNPIPRTISATLSVVSSVPTRDRSIWIMWWSSTNGKKQKWIRTSVSGSCPPF